MSNILGLLKSVLGFQSQEAFYLSLPAIGYIVCLMLTMILFKKIKLGSRLRVPAETCITIGVVAGAIVTVEEVIAFVGQNEFLSDVDCDSYDCRVQWHILHHPMQHLLQVGSVALGLSVSIAALIGIVQGGILIARRLRGSRYNP